MAIALSTSLESIIPVYTAPLAELGGGFYAEIVQIKNPSGTTEAIAEVGETIELEDAPEQVYANGTQILPAQNPASIQLGEYAYNPYTGVLQVATHPEARTIRIVSKGGDIPYSPSLLRGLPSLLYQIPVEGTIQLSRQFEQHPGGSIELETTARRHEILSIFAPGKEFELFGIPFRISNISVVELPRALYPDARCRVTLSLGGKWENYLSEICFLRQDGKNLIPEEAQIDPDCINPDSEEGQSVARSVSIKKLLSRINIPYLGIALPDVAIASDTPLDAIANPVQLLEERLRPANCFVRWSNPLGVETINIDGLTPWEYRESELLGEIQTSYEAVKPASFQPPNLNPSLPDLVDFPSTVTAYPSLSLRLENSTNLAFEYPNVELTGEFLDTSRDTTEATQGLSKPRFIRKPATRTTRIEGDVVAHLPLAGVVQISAMSLCFDLGGQTKTRSIITEEDGAIIEEINEVWGFAFTALQIHDDGSGKLKGIPSERWQLLKQTRTQHVYDKNTGYKLYIFEDGFNLVRFKQENAETPETLALDGTVPDELKLIKLYEFFRVPVVGATSYVLELMPEWDSLQSLVTYKVCNRDGTSAIAGMLNPNYAPDYYVKYERSESTGFASTSNPSNDGRSVGGEEKLDPDLIVGEESRFDAYTEVVPAVYEQRIIRYENGYPVYQQGAELSPAKFYKYQTRFKAQGAAIASALEEVFVEEGQGNPPLATRRPPVWVEQQETPNESKNQVSDTAGYRYLIQSEGYTVDDPINGSESFFADTLEKALIAARCKLAIENWRTGFSEQLQVSANLGIKEGDRFNYWCNGEYRQRVVLGVSHSLEILGIVEGETEPRIAGITSLSLGRYVRPSLTWKKVPLAKEPAPLNSSVILINPINKNIGEILNWNGIKSRRNP